MFERLISLRELAQLTGKPLNTLRQQAARREFSVYKEHHQIYVRLSEYEKYLQSKRIQGTYENVVSIKEKGGNYR